MKWRRYFKLKVKALNLELVIYGYVLFSFYITFIFQASVYLWTKLGDGYFKLIYIRTEKKG